MRILEIFISPEWKSGSKQTHRSTDSTPDCNVLQSEEPASEARFPISQCTSIRAKITTFTKISPRGTVMNSGNALTWSYAFSLRWILRAENTNDNPWSWIRHKLALRYVTQQKLWSWISHGQPLIVTTIISLQIELWTIWTPFPTVFCNSAFCELVQTHTRQLFCNVVLTAFLVCGLFICVAVPFYGIFNVCIC